MDRRSFLKFGAKAAVVAPLALVACEAPKIPQMQIMEIADPRPYMIAVAEHNESLAYREGVDAQRREMERLDQLAKLHAAGIISSQDLWFSTPSGSGPIFR